MNVAIVGSRDFEDQFVVGQAVLRLTEKHPDLTIVSGGARGADTIAETIARRLRIPLIIHLPDWNLHGKSAGFKRNDLIVRDADMVVAFYAPGPRSKGTQHTIIAAHLKGIPVYIYHEDRWQIWPANEHFPHYPEGV